MFTVGLEESVSAIAEVKMDSMSSDAVESVVEYMYTGNLTGEKHCQCDCMMLSPHIIRVDCFGFCIYMHVQYNVDVHVYTIRV